jgi:hypothetical protein
MYRDIRTADPRSNASRQPSLQHWPHSQEGDKDRHAIARAEVPSEYAYLDEELKDWQP